MTMTREQLREALRVDDLPLSAGYDPEWMIRNEMGPSSVWLAEYLAKLMDLRGGMRVLDLGCGKAMSSIFLAREFGVQVWATDLWISPTDNWARIEEAGLGDVVIPIHADARALPYADGFFDAVVSLDAYQYFGTDETYFPRLASLVRPRGQIGIVVPGLVKEFGDRVPEGLEPYWDSSCYTYHSPGWWARLLDRTGLVEIEVADNLPDGWGLWLKWETTARDSGLWDRKGDIDLLLADGGEHLSFSRLVARLK